MDNITWSKKSSATHDNGERNMCWRIGLPESDGRYLFTTKWSATIILQYEKGNLSNEYYSQFPTEDIIAYMKLPKPYKPD